MTRHPIPATEIYQNRKNPIQSLKTTKGTLFHKEEKGPFYDISEEESWTELLEEQIEFYWVPTLKEINNILRPLGVSLTEEQFQKELDDQECPVGSHYEFCIRTDTLWDLKKV